MGTNVGHEVCGCIVGLEIGLTAGCKVGHLEGTLYGCNVGYTVGSIRGESVGVEDGVDVGLGVGKIVGINGTGFFVFDDIGSMVDCRVGETEGCVDGLQ